VVRKLFTLAEREAIAGVGMTRAGATARVRHRGKAGGVVAAKRTASGATGKRKVPRTPAEAPDAARQPNRERRLVDVDPWAVLLEQLMEVPDENAPAGREGSKGK
jgi:hypothetical protein